MQQLNRELRIEELLQGSSLRFAISARRLRLKKSTIRNRRSAIFNSLSNPRRCSYPEARAFVLISVSNAVRIFTACSNY
jgi:hypothetical protein